MAAENPNAWIQAYGTIWLEPDGSYDVQISWEGNDDQDHPLADVLLDNFPSEAWRTLPRKLRFAADGTPLPLDVEQTV